MFKPFVSPERCFPLIWQQIGPFLEQFTSKRSQFALIEFPLITAILRIFPILEVGPQSVDNPSIRGDDAFSWGALRWGPSHSESEIIKIVIFWTLLRRAFCPTQGFTAERWLDSINNDKFGDTDQGKRIIWYKLLDHTLIESAEIWVSEEGAPRSLLPCGARGEEKAKCKQTIRFPWYWLFSIDNITWSYEEGGLETWSGVADCWNRSFHDRTRAS